MYQRPQVIRQVYVVCAVLAFAASFVPLYEPEEPGDVYQTMTMWSATRDFTSATGVLAIVLVLVLCATAVYGAQPGPQGRGAPCTLVVLAAIGALMLLSKAGEGSRPPSFGAGAGLLFGTVLVLLLSALVDLWKSLWVEAQTRPVANDAARPMRVRWNK